MLQAAKERNKIRFDPKSEVFTHPTNTKHTFLQCDLDFINYSEKLLIIAIIQFPKLNNLKLEDCKDFTFMPSFKHKFCPILTSDMCAFLDCVTMMFWKLYSDGFVLETIEPTPNRVENKNWMLEAKQLFLILQLRLSSFIALNHPAGLLNVEEYIVNAEEKDMKQVNSLFISDISALFDQLIITFNETEPQLPVITNKIPENIRKKVYDKYLAQFPIQKTYELYETVCCERLITPADYFINKRKYKSHTKYAPDVIRVKGGDLLPPSTGIKLEKLWNNPLFIDFIFVYAYRQKTHIVIENKFNGYIKNRLYNVWVNTETMETYASIADIIYIHYLNTILDDLLDDESEEDDEEEGDEDIKRTLNSI